MLTSRPSVSLPQEQWRDTRSGDTWISALDTKKLPCYNPQLVTSKNANIQCFEQLSFIDFAGNYQIRLSASLGTAGHDLMPNTDGKDAWVYNATVGHKTRDPGVEASAENAGGKICKCRYHKGIAAADPPCKGSLDPQTQAYVPPFEEAKVAQIERPNFFLGTVNTGNVETDIKTCTPWSEAYGFFFGDDTFKTDGIVFDVTEVVHGAGLLDNMVRLRSVKFSHVYPGATAPAGGAWTAFWTGGNKANSLMNNRLGRFRLETEVRFDVGMGNKSPIITAPPIISVLYQDWGANFSIPAYDPDSGDTVAFFLADTDEQGGLLGNEDLSGNLTWHIDMYRFRACQSSRGPDVVCRQTGSSGLDLTSAASYVRKTDPAEQLEDWSDAKNLPHQPPNLKIDPETGVVTWRTGKDPWTADSNGTAPVAPGFYNLVVMVEERKPGTQGNNTRGHGIKVPVDLLLYLHPPSSFCSLDCDNSISGNMLPTSESPDGIYGHAATVGSYPLGGTGSCKVCGGGGVRQSTSNYRVPAYEDVVTYSRDAGGQHNGSSPTSFCNVRPFVTGGPNGDPLQLPNSESCCNNGMTTDALEYGQATDFVRPMPPGSTFSGCLGAAYPSQFPLTIVPYTGIFDPCKKNTPPMFLTNETSPVGITPAMKPQSLVYGGKTIAMPPLVKKTFTLGSTVSYTLDAYDADKCNEISIKSADFKAGMTLKDHVRVTKNRVTRKFEWAPYRTLANGTKVFTDDPELDERERVTVTCFYATDGFEQTSHPPHCVEVTLLFPAKISWCASTPPSGTVLSAYIGEEVSVDLCVRKGEGVAAPVDIRMVMADIPGVVPYNPTLKIYGETNTTTPPVLPTFPPAPAMPNITNCTLPGGTVVSLVHGIGMNATTCQNATNASGLIAAALAPSPGHDFNATHYLRWTNPTEPFAPPYDSINFPEHGALDPPNTFPYQDPFTRRFRFTPREGQECVFTICFEGLDVSTSPGTPENPEETTPDKRCFKIEVHNSVLAFNGNGSASNPGLSAAMPLSKGIAATAWVRPSCAMSGGSNVTVLAFGSTRSEGAVVGVTTTPDVGLALRNSIGWTPGKSPGDPGIFYYADCRSGYAASAAAFACDTWHAVGFSVMPNGDGTFYVDGVERTPHLAGSADTLFHATVPFRTDSRPDPDVGRGTFAIGAGGFKGEMDDVRVWGAGLKPTHVHESMFARRVRSLTASPAAAAVGSLPLVDYTMRPGTGTLPPVINASGVSTALGSHPGVTPCVLGLDKWVSPVAGGCETTVFGWNFARGAAPKCGFGGRQARATYVSPTAVRCASPGKAPTGEATVTASNDGATFTDVVSVGKAVKQLALESSLWSAGGSGYGANADGVCAHLDTGSDAEVSFGGWFCPNCAE